MPICSKCCHVIVDGVINHECPTVDRVDRKVLLASAFKLSYGDSISFDQPFDGGVVIDDLAVVTLDFL